MSELERECITLTDLDSVDSKNSQVVSIVIGSNYWHHLITSAPKILSNGLGALNAKFGWTLCGPVPEVVETYLNVNIPTRVSCFMLSRVCDLWELDILGIREEQIDDVNQLVQEHFNFMVKQNEDGRYSVELPWKENPEMLPDDKAIALKQLSR